MAEKMIGRVLGNRYKLIAELGSGGMAWVYLAEDLVEDERVAVKILYPQHSQDLGFLQRFIREARLSMALTQSSPQKNVVRLLDYGADRDTHYLVMEYVSGQDLGQILAEQGALSWQTALNLARQVAVALDHAHRHEIVHRDIKPSNIMVLADGTVRVLDFGIARARTSPDLTLSGFVGSPNYAAPEQATGQPVDIRADIYSLGIVLYRMLSGELPFEGSTPWEVVNQHIATTPEPLEKKRPGLPRRVAHLVERAMAKRPEDRFQTPEEMAKAIDAVLAGQDLPDPTPMPGPAARDAALESLYASAQAAMAAENWQEAVDILSRILKLDADYRDVSELLSEVGRQIRLASLYRAARRALERGNWARALEKITKIEDLAAGYKDVDDLRARAERQEPLPAEGAAPGGEFPTQIEEAGIRSPAGIPPQGGGRLPDAAPPGAPPEAEEAGRDDRRRLLLWIGIPLLVLLVAAAILLLSGAVPLSAPTPTPTLTPTASPTATATLTPSATATIRPSPTASSTPSPTPSPTPSATPRASDTPTATPTLTPTATATRRASVTPAPSGQIAFPRYDPARRTYDVHVCRLDSSGQVDDSACRQVVAQASQPDFLPGGGQLVVHSWQPDNKGLAVHALNGRLVWRITGQIEAARPAVDFESQHYAYHSRQEADRQPRLYRSYGTETRPLSRDASVIRGIAPSWTPDGQILYSGCLGDACGIILMQANGANPRQIVAGGTETNPETSPDGRYIAFMSQRDGNWEVYVAEADGSNMQRITRDPGNDGLPAWSPDGRYLAFVSDRDGDWAVWVVGADGRGLQRLFPIGGPLDGPVQGAALYEVHGWVEERISWAPLP